VIMSTGRLKLRLVDVFRKSDALRLYEDFLRTQWLSSAEIQEIQWGRLTMLLDHAYRNVPYYRNVFDKIGMKPNDVRSIDDFRKLPILTKEIIRKNCDAILAKNRERFQPRKKATGGSTGVSLKFFIDRKSQSAHWAFMYRSWNVGGWEPGDRVVVLAGSSLYPSIAAFKKWWYVRLNNWLLLSAFKMSDTTMNEWVRMLRRFRAKFMYAYSSSAYLFAKYLERENIKDVSFKSVFTTAEVLHPHFRETIERVFSCEVFDIYGGTDGAGFAFECEKHKGLHVVSENSFIEILRDDVNVAEDGEVGEVISTDLFNYAMPFIRYKVGDISAFHPNPCDCGRGLPLLENIKGRSCDFVIRKDGSKVHGEFFSHLLSKIKWILQYYIVQENASGLSIYIKPDGTAPRAEIRKISEFLSKNFDGMDVNIVLTEKIPVTASGKFKFVVNKTSD